MGRVIGIDFGTTNSVVAVVESGRAVVIANREGRRLLPSVVSCLEDGNITVGHAAKRRAITHPDQTVFSIKRLLGRRYEEVRDVAEDLPYRLQPDATGGILIEVGGRFVPPQEIASLIIEDLKKSAEDYCGETVTDVVITVPAYYNDAQRQATREAAELAGLRVRRILNEPTAAALAYALDRQSGDTIAVFDLGGGTFDVSILKLGDDVVEVKATTGNTCLGGDNLDQRLMMYLITRFQREYGIDLTLDASALQRIREAAETAKHELSSQPETDINIPFLAIDGIEPRHLRVKLTRSEFEVMMHDILQQTVEPCHRALQDAGLTTKQIDHIVLVGGSTRIPWVQQIVRTLFGTQPHKGVNPDEVVALGAAVQGAMLNGDLKGITLLDVAPMSLGIETAGGQFVVLVPRNTTVPTRVARTVTTIWDNQESVEIRVFEGEQPLVENNRALGVFELSGIQDAPRGVPEIEVTFDVNSDGILNVTAVDRVTHCAKKATITTKRKEPTTVPFPTSEPVANRLRRAKAGPKRSFEEEPFHAQAV